MRTFIHFIFSKLFLCILLIAAQLAAIIFLCALIPATLPASLAVACVYLFGGIAALALIARSIPSEYKCAWLYLLSALPLIGVTVYLLAINGQPKKGGRSVVAAKTSGYERIIYLNDGEKYFDLLMREIDGAKEIICLEYYIISGGKIFDGLLNRLERAAERGVEIKIITDGFGSCGRLKRKEARKLTAIGAQIKIFHKLTPLSLYRLNVRDHRKIAAIDGKVAFIGGINIADEYANINSPYGYWKDTGIAIYGEAATLYLQLFMDIWKSEKDSLATCHKPGDADSILDGEGNNLHTLTAIFDCPSSPYHMYEDELARAIERADRRIYAFTPYLCFGERLERAVAAAARRGVDVKIIIPAVPDKKFTYKITLAYAKKIAAFGVQVYAYTPGFMHAKCVVCDDVALIGSYNLDFRSLFVNCECGARIEGVAVNDVVDDFDNCLALSKKCTFPRPALSLPTRILLNLFAPLI